MKKTFFPLLLLILFSLQANAQHAKEVWIDRFDFEGSGSKTFNAQTLRGEPWLTFMDNLVGGESKASRLYPVESKEHGKVLHLNYTLHQGEYNYDPFVGVYCQMQAATYPPNIVSIAYDYKGSSHAFMYCTSDIKDYNYYRRGFPASEEWTSIVIPLTDLFQLDIKDAIKVPFAPEKLTALQWYIKGKTNDSGDLMIDNIRFIYAATK